MRRNLGFGAVHVRVIQLRQLTTERSDMTFISKPFVMLFAVLFSGLVFGGDLAQFHQLDKAQLRAAERSMHEYLEPGTARLLREPKNDAERYVVQRQQRLAQEMAQPTPTVTSADGEQTTALFWPAARATQAQVDSSGRVSFQCVHASTMLGRQVTDFRHGNTDARAVR